MIRGWKFIVLLGGVVGIAAFFFPFITVSGENNEVTVSAFEAVTGMEAAEQAGDSVEVKAARGELSRILEQVKGFLYAVYAPAVLLTIIGLIGVTRMRVGRVLAFLSLLVGLAAGAIWYLLTQAAEEASAPAKAIEVSLGLGLHLLLATGIAGAVGGFVNFVKPDRGFPTI